MPPFGKPFRYTETLHFLSDRKPWWKFWGAKKQPVAWLAQGRACDDGGEPKNLTAQAYIMPGNKGNAWEGEMKISPIEPDAITPIYDRDVVEDLVIAQAEGKIFWEGKDGSLWKNDHQNS